MMQNHVMIFEPVPLSLSHTDKWQWIGSSFLRIEAVSAPVIPAPATNTFSIILIIITDTHYFEKK